MSWKDNFYYSKQERRGIAVLLVLILVATLIPTIVQKIQPEPTKVDYSAKIEELKAKSVPVEQPNYKKKYSKTKSSSIQNYQKQESEIKKHIPQAASSTKDRKSEDKRVEQTKRIQTNKEQQDIERVKNIQVQQQEQPQNTQIKKAPVKSNKSSTVKININTATAEEFTQLKGIGDVLSKRIVNFRTKLGGFVMIEQVGDTFGIESEVFQSFRNQLVLGNPSIQKHNFNTETVEQLAQHPYISKKLANQIINFREKVKPYESFTDVEKLYYFKNQPELYKKLKPYVTF